MSGRVVVEGGGPAPPLTFVLTRSAGGTRTSIAISQRPDGTFTVGGGRDAGLSEFGAPTGYRLKAMTYGSTDLIVEPLQVEAAKTQEILVALSSTSPDGEIGQRP